MFKTLHFPSNTPPLVLVLIITLIFSINSKRKTNIEIKEPETLIWYTSIFYSIVYSSLSVTNMHNYFITTLKQKKMEKRGGSSCK